MTAISTLPELKRDCELPQGLVINDVFWGYVARDDNQKGAFETIARLLASVLGLAFFLAAVGSWILPGSALEADLMSFKLGVSVIFCAFGALFLWYGTEPHEVQLQVDMERSELRSVVYDSKGRGRVLNCVPFEDVRAFETKRDVRDESMGRIVVKALKDDTRAVLFSAPIHQLFNFRRRLETDILGGRGY